MQKKSPVRLIVALTVAATAFACGEHASPTAPVATASAPSFSHAPPPAKQPATHSAPPPPPHGPVVAQCRIPADVWVSKRIGPAGGVLDLGANNTIVFPPGALLRDTTITAHIPAGNSAKAFFTPEGLQFAVPAIVTLSYSACITPTSILTIVYLQADTVSEVRPTQTDPHAKTVIATINHFSSYAVAY